MGWRTRIGERIVGQLRGNDGELTQKKKLPSKNCKPNNKLRTKFFKTDLFLSFQIPFTFCAFALFWVIPLVNLTVDINMVATRKKKPQNKKLLSQLSGSDTDFMILQSKLPEESDIPGPFRDWKRPDKL